MLGLGLNLTRIPRVLSAEMEQAIADGEAYADLLDGAGGTDIRENGELGPLVLFAADLYRIAGQQVDFWPLGSTQNMGTGSTVYSWLGEVGTLVNGPVWGVDGLRFFAVNGTYLTTTQANPGGVQTLLSSFAQETTTDYATTIQSGSPQSSALASNSFERNVGVSLPGFEVPVLSARQAVAQSVFSLIAGTTNVFSVSTTKDGANYLTGTLTNLPSTTGLVSFGMHWTGSIYSVFDGKISFGAAIVGALSQAQQLATYQAYASTLHPDLLLARQATRDISAYADLLLAQGGTDVRANGEYENLREFAISLYQTAGQPVEFFTLRSTQNMGTGSTAYGSLGTVATLVNGPTWGVDGMLVDAGVANTYATAGSTLAASNTQSRTLLMAATGLSSGSHLGGWVQALTDANGFGIEWAEYGAFNFQIAQWGYYNFTAPIAGVANAFLAGAYTAGAGAPSVLTVNGSSATADQSTAFPPFINRNFVAAGYPNYFAGASAGATSLVAFSCPVFGHVFNATQIAALRTAYKSTIGQGLGLP